MELMATTWQPAAPSADRRLRTVPVVRAALPVAPVTAAAWRAVSVPTTAFAATAGVYASGMSACKAPQAIAANPVFITGHRPRRLEERST